MNLFKEDNVKNYLSSLQNKSLGHYITTFCKCIENKLPNDAHPQKTKPYNMNTNNMTIINKLPIDFSRTPKIYITKTDFLDGDVMIVLIDKMLTRENMRSVEWHYSVLRTNFKMHPPCAKYMYIEYEQMLLTPYKNCLNGMAFWNYLMKSFNDIIVGGILYGDNKAFTLAFKRCLHICVNVLQIDFEASKKFTSRPLIMKCLNYNPQRRTRLSNIITLLDKLFNTGYDFQLQIVQLAMLIDDMRKL